MYFVIGATGKNGNIQEINIEFNTVENIIINETLKSDWSVTYRGDNQLLIYDEKGRFKKSIKLNINDLTLKIGINNLRISAQFSSGADIKLNGYVKIFGKKDIIKL